MKMTELFKKQFVFILFLIPICLFAQEDVIINEKLPFNAEKLEVIFNYSAITLFNTNTTKVTVNPYGDGKIKKRSGSGSTTKVLGITYEESKFKFFIDFNNVFNQSSNVTGTKKTSQVLETTEATISTHLETSKTWNLYLRIDKVDYFNIDKGSLTEGERSIKIIRSKVGRFQEIEELSDVHPETLFYEFIEDGVSLGAVTCEGGNAIWLKPDLDATTKLIICTAMLAIAS
jgi:hypothetical protein